jgi:holo-[acyl-carrier protein] synthase
MGQVALAAGIDIVEIGEVEEAITAHAERYLERVYTAREIEQSRGGDGAVDVRALAATFAAKEAALKLLRVGDEAIPWREIEVTDGGARLELAGAAAMIAKARGIATLQLSSTVTDEYAAAIVVAQTTASQ